MVPTTRSAIAFARGARNRRLHDRQPGAGSDGIERCAEAGIAVTDEEPEPLAASSRSMVRLRASWVNQAPVWAAPTSPERFL
jgi:hypothetical protein